MPSTRLTDFGSAFKVGEHGEGVFANKGSGTSAYLPPEALREQECGPSVSQSCGE